MSANVPQVAILAGGLGTRLTERTKQTPKPIIPVAGKPYLEWQIELLRGHGFTNFLLLTGYLAEQIEVYFGDGSRWDVQISYSREPKPLGTPARAESPDLPPGKYRITLGGEGVRHGRGPQDNLLHYAYIIAFGPRTEVAAALEGMGATTTIDLPRGGVIGAFLGDSYSGDNSGSVEVEIEAMR